MVTGNISFTSMKKSAVIILVLSIFCIPCSAACITYKICKGDTLSEIATKHNTSASKIAEANGISKDSTIRVGQTLKIPVERAQNTRSKSGFSPYYVHVSASNATLRENAGLEHNKVTVLPHGTNAKVIDVRGEWRKVALSDGTCGFVHSSLLMPGKTGEEAEVEANCPSKNKDLVQTALSYRGSRYSYGGASRGGFDCSGFTMYVFNKYGIKLPHSSRAQATMGKPVQKKDLQPGDLVFFQTVRRGISHVGIYIGDNKFVHAARYGRGVTTDSLGSSYYAPRYRGARRVK